MCLIIASPLGKRIPDGILEDAERSNKDGAGVGWYDQKAKVVRWVKDLTVDEVKKVIDEEVKGAPYAVHFRIATHGGTCPELTHPFSIDQRASIEAKGEAESILFHNGVVSNWKEILFSAVTSSAGKIPAEPWSDTRGVAWALSVYGKHLLSVIDSPSRFLVLDAAAKPEERMMIWGTWYDHDDFKFSNQGTRAFTRPVTASTASTSHSSASTGQTHDHSRGGTGSYMSAHDARREGSRGTTTRRKFTPNAGFTPWEDFTPEGGVLAAINESFNKGSVTG